MDSSESLSKSLRENFSRVSKEKCEKISKLMMEDDTYKDEFGKSGSDFEEDLKKERLNHGIFSSDDEDQVEDGKWEKIGKRYFHIFPFIRNALHK